MTGVDAHYRHIVLGAGGIGSATAHRLGRTGGNVLVVEQYAVGHSLGASEDHSRIIRHAYENPDYTVPTQAAYDTWAEVEREAGLFLVTRTGGLSLRRGLDAEPAIRRFMAAREVSGQPYEVLEAGEVMRRFPQWRLPADTLTLYQADSGILDIRRANAAHPAPARGSGARHHRPDVRPDPEAGSAAGDRAVADPQRRRTMSIEPDGSTLAGTLSGRSYTDPQVLREEQLRTFGVEWVYAGLASTLPEPGDVLRAQVGTGSVPVVRGRDGLLRGFVNVCRHRGAQLCLTGTANVGEAIRCRYHAWAYGLEGRLISAPNGQAMAGQGTSRLGLGAVSVRLWNGMICVTLDPAAQPLERHLGPQLGDRLGSGAARLDHDGIADLVVAARIDVDVQANCKLIQGNQECYHCGTIHPELVEQIPTCASFEAIGVGYPQDGYTCAADRDAFSLTGKATRQALPQLPEDDRRQYVGMVLRPNCFLSLLPDHVIVHRFQPLAPDRTKVVCEWPFRPQDVASPDFDCEDSVELFHHVNQQDFAAAEWCQPNMSSRIYRDGGVLVPLENEIIGNWYYSWSRARMGP